MNANPTTLTLRLLVAALPAATLAAQAGVRTLVLTHIAPNLDRPSVRERGLQDAAAVFDGTIVFGEELQTLDVSDSP